MKVNGLLVMSMKVWSIGSRRFIGILLLIELIDELIGSGMDSAWPLIKKELALSYSQVGLCMGLPAVISGVLDPITSLLGDIGRRRLVVLCGGLAFSFALLLRGVSTSFELLLFSLILPLMVWRSQI